VASGKKKKKKKKKKRKKKEKTKIAVQNVLLETHSTIKRLNRAGMCHVQKSIKLRNHPQAADRDDGPWPGATETIGPEAQGDFGKKFAHHCRQEWS